MNKNILQFSNDENAFVLNLYYSRFFNFSHAIIFFQDDEILYTIKNLEELVIIVKNELCYLTPLDKAIIRFHYRIYNTHPDFSMCRKYDDNECPKQINDESYKRFISTFINCFKNDNDNVKFEETSKRCEKYN